MKSQVPTPEQMLQAGVHYGHKSRHWHPKMQKFIYSSQDGIHIIDLYKTQKQIEKAMLFLYETAKDGKRIIFVGTKDQCKLPIEQQAKESGVLFVTERWFGGTLTNFNEIKRNRDELVELKRKMDANEFKDLTKRERLLISRKIEKLQKMHGGLVGLNQLPGAIVVVDAKREKTTINEANNKTVPVISLVDTNTDPKGISYIIASNDDAIKSIALIIRALGSAVKEGTEEYMVIAKQQETKQAEDLKPEARAKMPETDTKIKKAEKPKVTAKPVVKKPVVKKPVAKKTVKKDNKVNAKAAKKASLKKSVAKKPSFTKTKAKSKKGQ